MWKLVEKFMRSDESKNKNEQQGALSKAYSKVIQSSEDLSKEKQENAIKLLKRIKHYVDKINKTEGENGLNLRFEVSDVSKLQPKTTLSIYHQESKLKEFNVVMNYDECSVMFNLPSQSKKITDATSFEFTIYSDLDTFAKKISEALKPVSKAKLTSGQIKDALGAQTLSR